ncbi:choice-of-anchor A family protein, partial [Bacillus sp. E214]|uniref:choice-of-anchor A family protein n=1 Tax=Bacillus sp. E214 TaxID=2587156 RepID=UPI001652AB15
MKNKLFIFSIIFSLFISWLPVSNTQTDAATTYTNLGVANDFNIFVFNDHIQMNSDAEGRVAVGNKAHYTNYGIGDKLTESKERYDLIVGNSLYAQNFTNFKGNTAIGIDATYEFHSATHNNKVEGNPFRVDLKTELIDFEAVYNDLTYKSSKWSQLTPNGNLEKNGSNLTLRGYDQDLNIFNLTTEDLASGNVGLLDLVVPENSAVLINISGTDLSMGNFSMKNNGGHLDTKNGSRILWNFPELTKLDIFGFEMVGSLLAPQAEFIPSGYGNINGTVIVKDFINSSEGNYETHHHPFNVNLPLDEEIKGSIQITKVEKGTEKKLGGAIFNLYDNPQGKGQPVGEQTSDENGLATFENLSFGTYYLKEVQPPEGYELLTDMKEIIVNEEYPDVELTLENIRKEEPKGSIQITKVETGTDKKLKGAVLRLYD